MFDKQYSFVVRHTSSKSPRRIKKISNQTCCQIKSNLQQPQTKEAIRAFKYTITLFTPDTRDFKIHPPVFMKKNIVPLEKTPKLLGVVFTFTCNHYIKKTINSVKSVLNILKLLAGTGWGQDKETMVMTYKSVVRSKHIWSPSISKTNWERLLALENQGLKLDTGCLKITSSDHVHQETLVYPIREHCNMICKQYLATFHLAGHPGAKHLAIPPDTRNMKTTILVHESEVSALIPLSNFTISEYKSIIKTIHTYTVTDIINWYKPNRVLRRPPQKSAQLRKLYQERCNLGYPSLDPDSAECWIITCIRLTKLHRTIARYVVISPHDSVHLFQCIDNPMFYLLLTCGQGQLWPQLFLNLDTWLLQDDWWDDFWLLQQKGLEVNILGIDRSFWMRKSKKGIIARFSKSHPGTVLKINLNVDQTFKPPSCKILWSPPMEDGGFSLNFVSYN